MRRNSKCVSNDACFRLSTQLKRVTLQLTAQLEILLTVGLTVRVKANSWYGRLAQWLYTGLF